MQQTFVADSALELSGIAFTWSKCLRKDGNSTYRRVDKLKKHLKVKANGNVLPVSPHEELLQIHFSSNRSK